jgi:DNA-directed RNA polymerase specialized sigma24 family protein
MQPKRRLGSVFPNRRAGAGRIGARYDVAQEAEPIDFAGFYTATVSRVVGYLYVVLGSVAEAEDAAQEAYTRAWM